MKKLAVIMVAAMLVFSLAGQAAAYFEDFILIRSMYTGAGAIEIGSHLGADPRTFAVAPYNTTWPGQPAEAGVATPGPVPSPFIPVAQYVGTNILLSQFDGPLSSLYVGYWAHGQPDRDFWATGRRTAVFGGTDTDGMGLLGKKQSTADATYNAVQTLYLTNSSTDTAVIPTKTTTGTYFNNFEKSTNGYGGLGDNLAADSYEMTLSLAALSTAGYVDQLLYWFDYNGSGSTVAGVEVAVIRTFLTKDGRTIDLNGDRIATVINPNPVPIPGSVLLLASGLLGLFGFRRKRA